MNRNRLWQRLLAPGYAAFTVLVATASAWLQAGQSPTTLEAGVYRTAPDTTVKEQGDRVPQGSRTVPIEATLTFELNGPTPSLTAVIDNAVLEGGAPFPLTVRSASGARLVDGALRFTGDYLQELEPAGTPYGFVWQFTRNGPDGVLWSGSADWYGGHQWQVTFDALPLVRESQPIPEPAYPGLAVTGLAMLGLYRLLAGGHQVPVHRQCHQPRGRDPVSAAARGTARAGCGTTRTRQGSRTR